jgi:2-keto-4-pentenoate hydratase/2-oxohepta-3-ene-1,7-dioic acid hydratase in catechol pathway
MKLLQFYDGDVIRLGVKLRTGIFDASEKFSLSEIINGSKSLAALSEYVTRMPENTGLHEDMIKFAPCVPAPEKIICIGLNYHAHARETKADIPKEPVVFSKFNNTLAAAGENIPLPLNIQQADYEVELGVVVGRTARNVSVEDALNYVFGYCTINDLSARDWQFRSSQWLLGKTADKFLPCGPYLVTADEVANPQNLVTKTWVNGEIRQDSNTVDMIFSVSEVISYISQTMTLAAGDIISTGTPQGVILGMPQPRPWLKVGDEMVVEVEGLGKCFNRFVAG